MAGSALLGGTPSNRGSILRFGAYELDSRAGELRRQGIRVRLQEKPLRVLELLLSRRGEAVSRDELRAHLWPDHVFVDFDHSLNSAVSKLREALHDSAASPRFIETLPRGYRFIAAVDESPARAPAAPPDLAESPTLDTSLVPARGEGSVSGGRAFEDRPKKKLRWQAAAWVAGSAALVAIASLTAARLSSRADDPSSPTALAVLPFQNLSGNPDEDYFSDGITDEVIAQLGRVAPERLRVIARTSAMHYKHTNKRIDEIGAELGVAYILEGSVRRAGTRVRITAQLVRVRDQARVWARSYDRDGGDVLVVQTDVAQETARQIIMTFGRGAERPAPRVNPDVYAAYLKGRFFLDKLPGRLTQSIQYFEEAIKLDPQHAGAHAGLADAYEALGWGLAPGSQPPQEVYPRMLAAARRALELDPDLAAAHTSIARIQYEYDWNWRGAEESLRRALELDPNSAEAHSTFFDLLSVQGRHEEAYAHLQRAAVLDPLSVKITWQTGTHFLRAGDQERALEWMNKARELDPSSGFVHYLLGQVHIDRREYEAALQELQTAVRLSPDTPQFLATLGHLHGLRGDRPTAREVLRTLQRQAAAGYVSPFAFAIVHAALGERQQALDALEVASRHRDPWLTLLRVMRRFDSLRSEPRFAALLRTVGLDAPRDPSH